MADATAKDRFKAGERATVALTYPSGRWNGTLRGETVTVVSYWRNGYFTVREDLHRTTCALDADLLTAI